MKKKISVALGVLVLALVALLLPTSASADHGEHVWVANGNSRIVDSNTVELIGNNTSVETTKWSPNLFGEPTAKVTFKYKLEEGAVCSGGAPRAFVIIGGENTNSWDQLLPEGEQCGEPVEGGFSLVTFYVPAEGEIGHLGLVYDNGTTGKVTVEDLTLQISASSSGVAAFTAIVPGTEPTPSQTVSPSPSATQSESPKPTPSATTTAPTQTASPSATTSAPAEPQPCEAYVYAGGTNNQNLCAEFPGNQTGVDCADIGYQVLLVNVHVDPWGLDSDSQGVLGIGCESYPMKPTDEPTVTTSPASGVGGGDSGGLPLTGGKPLAVGGLGAVIIAVGAALFVLARRRRDEEEAAPETA